MFGCDIEDHQMIKNKAVNWSFDTEAFDIFRKDLWPIIEAVPGFLQISEAFFLYQSHNSWLVEFESVKYLPSKNPNIQYSDKAEC